MGERGFRNRAMLNQIATGVIYVGLLPSSCGGNIQFNLNRLCQQVIALNRLGFDQIVITIGKTMGVVSGVGRVRRINDAACVSCQARLYKDPAFSAVKTCFLTVSAFTIGVSPSWLHGTGQTQRRAVEYFRLPLSFSP